MSLKFPIFFPIMVIPWEKFPFPLPSFAAVSLKLQNFMSMEILTKEDLKQFKQELFAELKQFLQPAAQGAAKKWLKSPEVRKLLNISPGTLQNLRINGTLAFS